MSLSNPCLLKGCFHSGVTFWYSLIFNLSAHKCVHKWNTYLFTPLGYTVHHLACTTQPWCVKERGNCFRLHLWGGVLLCKWKCYTWWCDIRFSQSHNEHWSKIRRYKHLYGQFKSIHNNHDNVWNSIADSLISKTSFRTISSNELAPGLAWAFTNSGSLFEVLLAEYHNLFPSNQQLFQIILFSDGDIETYITFSDAITGVDTHIKITLSSDHSFMVCLLPSNSIWKAYRKEIHAWQYKWLKSLIINPNSHI